VDGRELPASGPGAGGPAAEEGGGRQRERRARCRHWGGIRGGAALAVADGARESRRRVGTREATTWLGLAWQAGSAAEATENRKGMGMGSDWMRDDLR
jgi:hypothetical protein